jgi:hypothetical protein
MIESQEVELDGTVYLWSHNETALAASGWHWSDSQRYVVPPTAIRIRLNRKFIDERAADVRALLSDAELERFQGIVREMGATDEQMVAVFGEAVELQPTSLRLGPNVPAIPPMPAAAHLPFNSKPMRDWFFDALFHTSLGTLPAQPPCGPVTLLGSGPFEPEELAAFISNHTFNVEVVNDVPEILVLGRIGWDKAELDELIECRVGSFLRIYSQEMYVIRSRCSC